MNIKYIGMDIHKETISIAVMNGEGKVVMESIIETKASTILQCIQGIHGDLHVTLEEGTWAAWLYDLLKPHVTELVVCDPRKNALMKEGNKSDKIDARKLADLLRGGYLRPVYHGENGLRTLKELARSYLTISKDLTRVMNRVKALYRSWGILCGGQQVYAPRHRTEWLNKIGEAGVRRRAEFFYQQLDALRELRQAVRKDLLAESRKQSATKLLRQVPSIGPIRAALLIALIQTPHRFRTKRSKKRRAALKGNRHWFERAIAEAGIRDFTWHCLRHTFASRLVMAGVHLATVKELMGHSTIAMTDRYAHLAPSHASNAIETLTVYAPGQTVGR
jgi:transposase